MCNCVNVKVGSYGNQVILPRPKCMIGRTEGTRSNTICIDRCIVEEIKYLWSLGVRTTGCCCGHNEGEGYIGVIDKDIGIMEEGGYKVSFNKNDLNDKSNFIPKGHDEEGGQSGILWIRRSISIRKRGELIWIGTGGS